MCEYVYIAYEKNDVHVLCRTTRYLCTCSLSDKHLDIDRYILSDCFYNIVINLCQFGIVVFVNVKKKTKR